MWMPVMAYAAIFCAGALQPLKPAAPSARTRNKYFAPLTNPVATVLTRVVTSTCVHGPA